MVVLNAAWLMDPIAAENYMYLHVYICTNACMWYSCICIYTHAYNYNDLNFMTYY